MEYPTNKEAYTIKPMKSFDFKTGEISEYFELEYTITKNRLFGKPKIETKRVCKYGNYASEFKTAADARRWVENYVKFQTL